MTFTIYYNRSKWHNLILHCIKPFIAEIRELLESWSVSFSTIQGEHIIFTIKLFKNEEQVRNKVLDKINDFLVKNPSENKIITYPLPGLFMDYPNNTVHFNLQKTVHLLSYTPADEKISQQISEIIIQALDDCEIDTESIFTFLMYAELGILRAVAPTVNEARTYTHKLLTHLDIDPEQLASNDYNSEQIQLIFEHNSNILNEIISDIWKGGSYSSDLEWMQQWIMFCRNFFTKKDFFVDFNILISLIYNHTGQQLSPMLLKGLLIYFYNISEKVLDNPAIN